MKKRTNMFLLLLSMLLLFFVGCARDGSKLEEAGTQSDTPEETMFEVGIDELPDIHVNQKFEISGFIKNNSNISWEISHGSGMFTYEIFDKEGKAVKQEQNILFRNDIGYALKMESNGIYRNNGLDQRSKEFYEFVIKKPGKYTVKSKAEFRIKNENKGIQELIITSKDYELLVK